MRHENFGIEFILCFVDSCSSYVAAKLNFWSQVYCLRIINLYLYMYII